MNRYLQEGAVLKNPTDKGGIYKIKDIIGTGTTCVVYRADFLSNDGPETQHLLKEYNPRTIALERADDYSLYVRNEKDSQTFNEGLDRFKEGINKQAEVRRCSELTNSTSNIQHTFTANKTFYVDMTLMAGETYDKVKEKSLHNLLRRIKAITKVVNNYHQQGLLHLDIKPENIFILLDTVELVQMFDFDSVIEKDKVISAPTMSYTQNWAAQEQLLPYGRKRICEATDLFAIGEILFYKLMDRHSTSSERYSYASYQFDTASELFKDINPKIFPVLAEILSHTICNVVSQRYQSADILLKKLDEAINLANPTKPFLQHSLPPKTAFFVGRDSDLSEIDNRLKQTDKLFITGMGGMGKSELCKQYAHLHKAEYDAVIFAVCNTDLESMILDDKVVPIANMQMASGEKASEYFKRKYPVLKSLCTKHVLLIVDNLNDMQDGRLNDILQLNCKILITTRCDVTDYNYEQFYLGAIEGATHIRSLFDHWYPEELLSADDNAAVEQILTMYARHTLAIELIAKQMKASNIKPQKMLEKLTVGGLNCSGKERVVHGGAAKTNTYGHIRHLFDVSGLSDNQIYILANLSLIPISGINKEQFYDWCKLEDYDDINTLVEFGWVQQDTDKNLISLHPVIADIMIDMLKQQSSHCEQFLESIILQVSGADFAGLKPDQREYLSRITNVICSKLVRQNICTITVADFFHVVTSKLIGYCSANLGVLFLMKALEIYEQHAHRSDLKISELYNCIGAIRVEIDDFKSAEAYFKKALEIDSNLNIPPNIHTANVYSNLGNLYAILGLYKKSVECLDKALNIQTKLHNSVGSESSSVYNEVGSVYFHMGKYDKAEKAYKEALHIATMRENNQPNTATIHCDLGILYNEVSRYNDALLHHKQALEIRLKIFGENHADTAHSYEHLGMLYGCLGKSTEADTYCKKALEINLQIYGANHSTISRCYNNLGTLHYDRGEYKNAETYFSKSLDMTIGLLGKNHPSTASAYDNLAMLYSDLGEHEKAEACCRKALFIRQIVCGPSHVDTITSYNNLGTIFYNQNRYKEAKKWFKKALVSAKKQLGANHDLLARSYSNLGRVYLENNQPKKAKHLHEKALQSKISIYGEESVLTAVTYVNLAVSYNCLHRFEDAKTHLHKALEIYRKEYGEAHINTAKVYENLAIIYDELDEHDKAKILHFRALDITKQLCGTQHNNTARIYHSIGSSYRLNNEYDEAEKYFQMALAILMEHPDENDGEIEVLQEEIALMHSTKCTVTR